MGLFNEMREPMAECAGDLEGQSQLYKVDDCARSLRSNTTTLSARQFVCTDL